MTKKRPVAPELKTPIKVRLQHPTLSHGSGASEAAAEANAKEKVRAHFERLEKLELLFSHYGVSRTGDDAHDFGILALMMACDFFPGFEIDDVNEPKPYRHKRGNWLTLMTLFADVEIVKAKWKAKRPCTDSAAIDEVMKRFPSKWGRENKRTLQNWLVHAHKNKEVAWSKGLAPDLSFIELFRSDRPQNVTNVDNIKSVTSPKPIK